MQLPPLILKEVREVINPQEEESPDKQQKNRLTPIKGAVENSKNLSQREKADDYCSNNATLIRLVPIGSVNRPPVHARKLTADLTNYFKMSSVNVNSHAGLKSRKSTSSTRLIPRSKLSNAMASSCSSRATTAETSTLSGRG